MYTYTAGLSGRHTGNVVVQKAEGGEDPCVSVCMLLGSITRLLGSQLAILDSHALKPDLQDTS